MTLYAFLNDSVCIPSISIPAIYEDTFLLLLAESQPIAPVHDAPAQVPSPTSHPETEPKRQSLCTFNMNTRVLAFCVGCARKRAVLTALYQIPSPHGPDSTELLVLDAARQYSGPNSTTLQHKGCYYIYRNTEGLAAQ
eukprot:1826767-Rhodomonas_salina.1